MADKRFIANTKIHDKEIAQWLSDYFGRPVTLKTCKANKIGAGQGCTASVFRLELEYDGEQDSLPKSAVLKVPSRAAVKESYKKLITDEDADVDEEVESHIASHAIECMTYKILGKHSPLPLPIIYAARPFENEKVGAILMEDLDEKAATIGDQTCTLPLDKMYEVADTLAEFHAWCITTNYDWKRHFDPPYCDHRKQAYHDKEFAIMKKCFEVSRSLWLVRKTKLPGFCFLHVESKTKLSKRLRQDGHAKSQKDIRQRAYISNIRKAQENRPGCRRARRSVRQQSHVRKGD